MKTEIRKCALTFFALFLLSTLGRAQTCTFSLGNDTSICQGLPININIAAPTGGTAYLWDNSSTAASRHITAYGTYYCRYTKNGTNIVTNGNFSSGTSGFTSSYTLGPTGSSWGTVGDPGTYAITTNAHNVHSNFPSFGNHSPGSGNMMVVNGSSTPNTSVWCQNISITANTDYNFSTWAATCIAANISELSILQFSINGTVIGTPFSPSLTSGVWTQFNATWNSGASTSANICIVNQNTNPSGNDFAIDDIFFQPICVYTDTFKVKSKPYPTGYTAGVDQTICSGTSVNLTASIGTGVSATWFSNPAGFTSTQVSPTVTPNDTTEYLLTIDLNDCKKYDTVKVNVNHTPVPQTGADVVICDGKSVTFTGNEDGGTVFGWTSNPPGFTSTQATITVTPAVSTTYTLTSAIGTCVGSNDVDVTVNPAPSANFSVLAIDSSCNSYTVAFTNLSTNATTYYWEFGDGELSPDVSPIHVYRGQDLFRVKLISTTGSCESIQIIPLKISFSENSIFVPTSFTPNSDFKNDTFYIPKGCLQTVSISIYDRWGILVKQWTGLDGFWDGKLNGTPAPEGAYVCLLDGFYLSGERVRKKITLTVFR